MQVASLDELPQACLDPWPDPAQIPDPAGADELRNRDGRVAHDVRDTPVCPRAVRIRAGELEQGREGFELRGDLRVLWIARRTHPGSVSAVATVVVPFRAAAAKRRLDLPEEERADLAHAMLGRVLAAAVVVGRTVLVTETDAACARALAAEHGAEVLDDPGTGQGEAVAAALAVVKDWPVLVVNADLPTAQARDIFALLGAMPAEGMAIAEAEDGTTNALAISRPALFAPVYGPGSAARFRAHAASNGAEAVTLYVRALAEDVDTVAHLQHLSS